MQQPTTRSSHDNIRKHSYAHINNEIVTKFISKNRRQRRWRLCRLCGGGRGGGEGGRDPTPSAHKCSSPWPTTPVATATATTALPAFSCSQRPVGVVTSESWSLPNIQVKHHENGKSVTDRVFVYLECLSVGSNRGF
jgi:hypothetical protein